ncbi:MAG TPA: HNH endonuclease signature motif containing protein [Scandinavium sp.]|jgi:hypothetical protein
MSQVKNREGMMIELPEPTTIFPRVELSDGRYSKPKNKITKAQRAELRMKFGGRCAYCGCELPEKGWHADHVEPVRRDFEFVRAPAGSVSSVVARSTGKVMHPELHAIDNLYPACAPCNLFKSAFSVEMMRKEISKQAERARAYSVNFRTAERFGIVAVIEKPVVFWFEQYQGGE